MVGNLYVHVKDDRRHLFVREDATHTPFIFESHKWKLVVSGYAVSERDLFDILNSAQYFEFSMPRPRAR